MIGQVISHYKILEKLGEVAKLPHERSSASGWRVEHPAFFRRELQEVAMIGATISHYKILEKLGEVPKSPTSVSQRVAATLRIPPSLGGSWRRPR